MVKRKKKAPELPNEFLLYQYAAKLTEAPDLDPRNGIHHPAYHLLMRTYMATADLAGESVTVKVRTRTPKRPRASGS
jgi:hypothetical protein